MLRVKKGATNKARGYIKITIDTNNLSDLPTEYAYEQGTYLGYQDTVDGSNTIRTYLYSPETIIDTFSLSNSGVSEVDISRVGFKTLSFNGCSEMTRLGLDRIKCDYLVDMDNFLYNCVALEYVTNLDKLDVSYVKFLSKGFGNLRSLKEPLNISNWQLSNNMRVPTFEEYPFDNIDFVNNWDMSNNRISLFNFIAYSNIKSIDLSNTGLVLPDGNGTFRYANELETINLSNVNMDDCENIEEMFLNDAKLTTLDLTMVKTISNGKNAFKGCTNLILLDLSNLELTDDADITGIFDNTPNLLMPTMNYCSYETKVKIKDAYDNRIL